MIGRCFLTLNDECKVRFQGVVKDHVHGSLYLVQYFEALMGEPNTMEIVNLAAISNTTFGGCTHQPHAVIFFEDDKHLRHYLEYGGGRYLRGGG